MKTLLDILVVCSAGFLLGWSTQWFFTTYTEPWLRRRRQYKQRAQTRARRAQLRVVDKDASEKK